MIDNFALIQGYMQFAPDLFYWVQIIKRRKENPEMSTGCRIVDNFYVESLDDFTKYTPKIQEICHANNARAYIYLNRRSYTKVAFRAAKLVAEHLENGQYKAVKNAYQSACGQVHAETEKTWIIDIDSKNYVFYAPIDIRLKVPTINGYHLIVRPFNRELYKYDVAGLDIQKDNPTLLYYRPKS